MSDPSTETDKALIRATADAIEVAEGPPLVQLMVRGPEEHTTLFCVGFLVPADSTDFAETVMSTSLLLLQEHITGLVRSERQEH